MRRLYNLLRSRTLAFWLIGLFTAYATAATVLAEGDFERAYTTPLFYVLACALALATAACAAERTGGAIRAWRRGGETTQAFVERLEQAPQIAVAVAEGTDPTEAFNDTGKRLRRLGLGVRVGAKRLAGRTPRITLLGSPLFHWALVAIFVLVAAGRLTRSEGMIGVPVGTSRIDEPASYGALAAGPWNASFSGLTIAVPELTLRYESEGIDRGAVPLVELYRGEQLITRQRVYANRPLRHGSLMVHSRTYGLAGTFTLHAPSGDQRVEILYDFVEGEAEAINALPLAFNRNGRPVALASRVPLGTDAGDASSSSLAHMQVDWSIDEGGTKTTGTIAPGDTIDLGDGASLTLEGLTYYARLSVVDDWSVYPLYAAFLLALCGLALALLLPPKMVWVMLVEREGTWVLHARTRQARGNRVFADDVEELLSAAAQGGDEARGH